MSLLGGDIARDVFAAFKGQLQKGLIRQIGSVTSGGLDDYNDPIDGIPVLTACEGFVEDYDDSYRARAGIPDMDVKVNIFAQSIPAITPTKDDQVQMPKDTGPWYQLRRIRRDPATAMWSCQAFEIPAPEST